MRDRAMKITNSQDGTKRFTLKMEARISVEAMATYLVIGFKYEIPSLGMDDTLDMHKEKVENSLKNLMSGKSTKDLLEIVREVILNNSLESPYYEVADNNLSYAVEFLTGYLKRKYKGFSI